MEVEGVGLESQEGSQVQEQEGWGLELVGQVAHLTLIFEKNQ